MLPQPWIVIPALRSNATGLNEGKWFKRACLREVIAFPHQVTTLRYWTDEGKIGAFITSGDHWRYSEIELRLFMGSRQGIRAIKDLAAELEDTASHHHREIAQG